MSAVTGFANLSSGDRLNITTPLSIKIQKKNNEKNEQKLAPYREHYRTSQISVPDTNVKDLGALLNRMTFKPPPKFIQYTERENEENTVEYDVDEEDLEWLIAANANRIKNSKSEISIEKFEIAIDRMEKCCKFEPQSTAQCADDEEVDDVCCVCADGDVSNANQIIYCDMCNIAVHQDCYGVPYIPEGSWLCRRCKLSPSAPVQCCLCPNPFGAFKPTSDGRWAHVVCAIWLNEVHFGNAVFLEPVEGCRETLKIRKSLRCLYCREKQGACLQCSSRSCFKAFHVTCAQQLGLVMKVETVHDKTDGEEIDVKRFVYCQKHEDGNNMTKREIETSIRNARRNLEASGGYKPTITLPSLSRENVDKIQKETKIDNFDDIVVYWYQKRKSRAGVPLIKRLNVEVVPKERRTTSNNVYDGLSEIEKKTCENFRIIRNSLETARLLSEQVKKREINKRAALILDRKIFETALIPTDVFLQDVLKKIVSKDQKKVFAEPVKLDGYSLIIKQPMDLSLMRKKSDTYKYSTLNEIRKDIILMTDNCTKFNHDNEYFFKYGKRFRKQALEILEEAEIRKRQIDALQTQKDTKFWEMYKEQLISGCSTSMTEKHEEEKEGEETEHYGGASTSKEQLKVDDITSKMRKNNMKKPPVLVAQSPIEQDEQNEDDQPPQQQQQQQETMKPVSTIWKAIFTGAGGGGGSQKRKATQQATPNGTATTPKRRKDTTPSIRAFFPAPSSSSADGSTTTEPLTFASIVRNGHPIPGFGIKSPTSSAAINRVAVTGGFRRNESDLNGVKSPMMADTASSTEYSTDEEGNIEKMTPQNNSKNQSSSASTRRSEKKKSTTSRLRNTTPKETPLEKAKSELKSIFAHNAIVSVDGKAAAKVIDTQLAHVLDIPREQRHNMIISKPGRNGSTPNSKKSNESFGDDDKKLVYVEFFQKTNNSEQYKWVSSERITLIDLSNTNKSKIVGWKAAKEWQQNIMNKS